MRKIVLSQTHFVVVELSNLESKVHYYNLQEIRKTLLKQQKPGSPLKKQSQICLSEKESSSSMSLVDKTAHEMEDTFDEGSVISVVHKVLG